jgi:hypothetical protein
MHVLRPLIHLGGFLHSYKNIPLFSGGLPSESGCDHLKRTHAKHFAGGIEVRDHFPDIPPAQIFERAREAIDLAKERYADCLLHADLLVRESPCTPTDPVRVGYPVDLDTPRDFSAFLLIDILVNRPRGKAAITGTVFNHAIDGVPFFFQLHRILDHILAGGESYIARCRRVAPASLQRRLDELGMRVTRSQWLELDAAHDDAMIPAGARIDVTDSCIPKLQARLRANRGIDVPCSIIEEGLLAVALGCDSVQDCVARLPAGSSHGLGVTGGYDGIGLVRSRGYQAVANRGLERAAEDLADILVRSAAEVERERNGTGSTSVFLERYRRIPRSQKEFFEKRLSPAGVGVVSGHELQGSSLSGIDFGVPLGWDGLSDEDVEFTAFPAHAEHSPATLQARRQRGLDTRITRFSVLFSPLWRRSGRRYLFKAIKCAPGPAAGFLRRLGVAPGGPADISGREAIRNLYTRLYSPADPAAGWVETLARQFLQRLEATSRAAQPARFRLRRVGRSPAIQ